MGGTPERRTTHPAWVQTLRGRTRGGARDLLGEKTHLLEVSISKKALLKCDFAENLPTFDDDATQIRQVVMYLITNASKAIGDKTGVITLSTGAMRCEYAEVEKSVFRILDYGILSMRSEIFPPETRLIFST